MHPIDSFTNKQLFTLFQTWVAMRHRCNDAKGKHFKYYGGRGITVCERWNTSFDAFASDMGPRPPGKFSIDRIDVNKGYSPDNCRWADAFTQNRNKRNTKVKATEVPFLIEMLENGASVRAMAQAFGISEGGVRNILVRAGIRLRDTARVPHAPSAKIDEKTADLIRERYFKGEKAPALARDFGICTTSVYNAVHYRTWMPSETETSAIP